MSALHMQLLCDILLDIVMVCIYLCNIHAFVSSLYICAIHSYKTCQLEEFVNRTNHNKSMNVDSKLLIAL